MSDPDTSTWILFFHSTNPLFKQVQRPYIQPDGRPCITKKKKIVSVLRNKYVEVKQSWKDQQSWGIGWRNQWLIQRHEHLLNSEMSANYCGMYTGFRRGMLVKRTFLTLIMFGWPDCMALIYFIWNCYVYFGIGKDLWWVIILKHCPRASTKCLLFYDVVPKSQRLIIWQ